MAVRVSAVAQTISGVDVGPWMIRNRFDKAAVALADRHYSRRPDKIGSNQLGGVGRALTLVSPCERALWVTRYLLKPMDTRSLHSEIEALFKKKSE